MGHMPDTADGDAADGARELDRGHGEGALADGDGRRFSGIPFLAIVAEFPLGRRHGAGRFVGQIDAGCVRRGRTILA